MKHYNHQFMRAMLFIAVLFTSLLGVAASAPGLLTDTDLPQIHKPNITATVGVGKYTVDVSGGMGTTVYCRINSGEWFRYKQPIVFDEYGSYLIEAYTEYYGYSPSDIVSKRIEVNEHTGENLVYSDADDTTIIIHDGFKYKIHESTVSLTRQVDKMCNGDLVIPASITHKGVTYPVTEVESWACSSTYNITSVQIPSTVTKIGDYSFMNCPKLRSIDVDPANPNYCDIDGVLFNKSGTTLLSYPNSRATSYAIPAGVTMINHAAFEDSYDLESVTFPNSVTRIRTSAFTGCVSLKSVVLPSNLRTFDISVFTGCWDLKSVTFPSSLIEIPGMTFSNCYSLDSVYIPGNVKTIGAYAFEYCYGLSSVTIGEGVQNIQNDAFSNCRSIHELTIPSSVISIDEASFFRCSSLTAFHVDPANANYCDVDGVLYNKDKTLLLAYAFGHPRSSYDILPTTQTIGKRAFFSSDALQHINIPSSVTTIGEDAFFSCESLLSVDIPSSVTTIGEGAFYNCSSLASVTLPINLTVIPGQMMNGCESLKEITIPAAVTSIGMSAFRDTPLEVVNCLAVTPPALASHYGFDKSTINNGILYVPQSSLEAYQSADVWSTFANIRGIQAGDVDGDGVLSINDATALVDYILSGNNDSFFSINADTDGDGVVGVSDLTNLIDLILTNN